MTSDVVAVAEIERLKQSIGEDWRYQIHQRRGRGPYFSLSMRSSVLFTSSEYSSCEMMERAIASLKMIAPAAEIVFSNETPVADECSQVAKNSRRPTCC
jgi:uncharacterized protein YegP (UPF0339 family)